MTANSKDPSAPVAQHADFSLERISRLVFDLEQELALAPSSAPGLDALREEIANLKRALASPVDEYHQLEEQLHGMRGKLSDFAASVEGEVLKDTPFIAELGRILGLI